jgi:hypothetical protein
MTDNNTKERSREALIGHFEPAGTEFQIEKQLYLALNRDTILKIPNLSVEGRCIDIVDPSIHTAEFLEDLIRQHYIINFHFFNRKDANDLLRRLDYENFIIHDDLVVVQFDYSTKNIIDFHAHSALPEQYTLETSNERTCADDIKVVQNGQKSSGMNPLPGYRIRSNGFDVHTLTLRDKNTNEIVAATLLHYYSNYINIRDNNFGIIRGAYVAEAHRNRNLGRILNAILGKYILECLSINKIYAYIHKSNIPSLRMTKSLGRSILDEHINFFVEDRKKEQEFFAKIS